LTKTISGLIAADTPLSGAESFEIVQAGQSRKATLQQMANAMPALVPADDPLVFLFCGQSELEQRPAIAPPWAPNANCFWWNWNDVDGAIGTTFLPITTTATIRISERFASEVARLYPGRKVYVINIAKGGQDISHWMVGASAPDLFQNTINNVTAALAALNRTKIDGLGWYQGTTQTLKPYEYANDLETVFTRFKAQSWFPATTPIMVVGLAPTRLAAPPRSMRRTPPTGSSAPPCAPIRPTAASSTPRSSPRVSGTAPCTCSVPASSTWAR
jgi:hypothetical protein